MSGQIQSAIWRDTLAAAALEEGALKMCLCAFQMCLLLPKMTSRQGSCGVSGRLYSAQVLLRQKQAFRLNHAASTTCACFAINAHTSAGCSKLRWGLVCWQRNDRGACPPPAFLPTAFRSPDPPHRQPFGPNGRWKWSSSTANYEVPHWGLYQFYGGSGYNVDVFGSAETFKQEARRADLLIASSFLS